MLINTVYTVLAKSLKLEINTVKIINLLNYLLFSMGVRALKNDVISNNTYLVCKRATFVLLKKLTNFSLILSL